MRIYQALVAAVIGSSSTSNAESIKCAGGWGSDKERVIPSAWIDDGYCDCPLDGQDEPGTGACSGASVGGWPGVKASSDASLFFQCPQQPNLKVPISRVHDGICDCCDGVDEEEGNCPDICDQVLAEERAAKQKMEAEFTIGYNQRQADLQAFQTKIVETKAKIETMEQQVNTVTTNQEAVAAQMESFKHDYMGRRIVMASTIFSNDDLKSLLEPLSNEELVSLVVHACQVAGEMDSAQDVTTCVPLRLAGLDMALMLGEENFDQPESITVDRGLTIDLAELLYQNKQRGDDPIWKLSNGRRRLMSEDEDYMGDADYLDPEDDTDEYPEDDDGYYRNKRAADKKTKAEPVAGKHKEVVDEIKAMLFSKTRVAFTERSKQITDEISKILDTKVDDEDSEGSEKAAAAKSDGPPVDPVAHSMVKSNLKRKDQQIERGFKYAASAELLLSVLQTWVGGDVAKFRTELMGLAAGTLYYGKLRSDHVWQILQAVLPEFSKNLATQEQTCASPWAGSCPPQTIVRKSVHVPPAFLVQAAEALCAKQVDEALAGACEAASGQALPTSIPEGYYGYTTTIARGEDDYLTFLFSPMDSVALDTEKLNALEEEKEDLEKRKNEIQKEINEMWDSIGGKKLDKFGPDGELASLTDKCHAVTAGKYTYEVCLFGQAHQKDRDNAKDNGTLLGRWKGLEYDSDGTRILKWDQGAKCWNGPSRSATVYVRCGAENKVLSADEPDTCRYVLQMESHIACDDRVKEAYGL